MLELKNQQKDKSREFRRERQQDLFQHQKNQLAQRNLNLQQRQIQKQQMNMMNPNLINVSLPQYNNYQHINKST